MSFRVVLDRDEVALVEFVGAERAKAAVRNGRRRMDGLPSPDGGSDLPNDVTGAAAEYAVAKVTRLFWHALRSDVRKDVLVADVGASLHVKAITNERHNLLVKSDDPRFGWYVLCLVDLPTVEVLGFKPAHEITERHWRSDLPVPAFCIPQAELRPVAS